MAGWSASLSSLTSVSVHLTARPSYPVLTWTFALLFLFSEPAWPPCFWPWTDHLIFDFQLFPLSQMLRREGQIRLTWLLSARNEPVGGPPWGAAGPGSVRDEALRPLPGEPHLISLESHFHILTLNAEPCQKCSTKSRKLPQTLLEGKGSWAISQNLWQCP